MKCCHDRSSHQPNRSDPYTFFAQAWLKRNLALQSLPPPGACNVTVATTYDPAAAVASKAAAAAGAAAAAAAAAGGNSTMRHAASSGSTKPTYQQQMNKLSTKHAFSSYVVLLLQSLSLLPSLLLIGYMILQKISRQTWGSCPLQSHEGEWLPVLNNLGLRVLWQLILSSAAVPLWTYIAFKKSPR